MLVLAGRVSRNGTACELRTDVTTINDGRTRRVCCFCIINRRGSASPTAVYLSGYSGTRLI